MICTVAILYSTGYCMIYDTVSYRVQYGRIILYGRTAVLVEQFSLWVYGYWMLDDSIVCCTTVYSIYVLTHNNNFTFNFSILFFCPIFIIDYHWFIFLCYQFLKRLISVNAFWRLFSITITYGIFHFMDCFNLIYFQIIDFLFYFFKLDFANMMYCIVKLAIDISRG